jgi:hypothetical protein
VSRYAIITESAAICDVVTERRRQIEAEGWTAEHDDRHHRGELARAASAYAYVAGASEENRVYLCSYVDGIHNHWPISWGAEWWKPTDRRRDLVKAAAMAIAEIERLDRQAQRDREGK